MDILTRVTKVQREFDRIIKYRVQAVRFSTYIQGRVAPLHAKAAIAACPLALLMAAMTAPPALAEPRWIKARIGSFEAISDDGRKPALQALSQFEQFSFALGTALGKP